jgi:hypothetical protein
MLEKSNTFLSTSPSSVGFSPPSWLSPPAQEALITPVVLEKMTAASPDQRAIYD